MPSIPVGNLCCFSVGRWIGWWMRERKGKERNRYLRGRSSTSNRSRKASSANLTKRWDNCMKALKMKRRKGWNAFFIVFKNDFMEKWSPRRNRFSSAFRWWLPFLGWMNASLSWSNWNICWFEPMGSCINPTPLWLCLTPAANVKFISGFI